MISAVDQNAYSPTTNPTTSSSAQPTLVNNSNPINLDSPSGDRWGMSIIDCLPQAPSTGINSFQRIVEMINEMITALRSLLGSKNTPTESPIPDVGNNKQPSKPWYELIDEEPGGVVIPDLNPGTPSPSNPSNGPSSGATPPGSPFVLGGPDEIPDLDPTQTKKPEAPQPTAAPQEKQKTPPKEKNVGKVLSASGEFLWKPVSDKDKNLAVLLPSELTGKIKSVVILSPDKTKVLGTGKYSGVGNGNREHFRFSKAGGQYPDGAIVLITLKDGSTRHITIKDSSQRFTR